jgi:sugar phosphate isomerase/epimerase
MIPAIWSCIYHKLPLHAAVRALDADGWRATEIGTEHLVALEEAAESEQQIELAVQALAETRIAAPQAHAFLAANVAQADLGKGVEDRDRLYRHILLAKRLGVRNVVMHPGRRRELTTRAERAEVRRLNCEAFRRLGDCAGEQGMMIGLENLMSRDCATPAELFDLLEAIGHPAIGFTLDSSHAHAAGLDVAEVVREFGKHTVALHISDNNRSGDAHLVPGGGTIDWPAVMQAFREVGYAGIFNLEIPGERHAVAEIQRLKLRHALNVSQWLASL